MNTDIVTCPCTGVREMVCMPHRIRYVNVDRWLRVVLLHANAHIQVCTHASRLNIGRPGMRAMQCSAVQCRPPCVCVYVPGMTPPLYQVQRHCVLVLVREPKGTTRRNDLTLSILTCSRMQHARQREGVKIVDVCREGDTTHTHTLLTK